MTRIRFSLGGHDRPCGLRAKGLFSAPGHCQGHPLGYRGCGTHPRPNQYPQVGRWSQMLRVQLRCGIEPRPSGQSVGRIACGPSGRSDGRGRGPSNSQSNRLHRGCHGPTFCCGSFRSRGRKRFDLAHPGKHVQEQLSRRRSRPSLALSAGPVCLWSTFSSRPRRQGDAGAPPGAPEGRCIKPSHSREYLPETILSPHQKARPQEQVH